ncbi:hypothetical protein Ancab_035179, partial [Ancistrocladus abbreviatus]
MAVFARSCVLFLFLSELEDHLTARDYMLELPVFDKLYSPPFVWFSRLEQRQKYVLSKVTDADTFEVIAFGVHIWCLR